MYVLGRAPYSRGYRQSYPAGIYRQLITRQGLLMPLFRDAWRDWLRVRTGAPSVLPYMHAYIHTYNHVYKRNILARMYVFLPPNIVWTQLRVSTMYRYQFYSRCIGAGGINSQWGTLSIYRSNFRSDRCTNRVECTYGRGERDSNRELGCCKLGAVL